MQTYKYKAISKGGKNVSGVIEAYDEYEAVAAIKKDCDVVTKIEEVKEKKHGGIDLTEPVSIPENVLSLISSQFTILLKTGLPVTRTVEIVANQTTDKYMKKILLEVQKDVDAGYTLARSLESHGKKIPATFIETIKAGEASATLPECFQKLADYYDKRGKLKKKVKSALTYPTILIILMVVVVIVVVRVAVPTVLGMILDTGGEVPVPTKVLIWMYDFLGAYWWILVILAALVIAGIIYVKNQEKGRMKWAQMQLKIPIMGKIATMNAASQFASTLATLITSGLSLTKAVGVTGKVIDNFAVGTRVCKYAVGLEEGKKLGSLMKDDPYLPPLLVEMTSVGDESGSLESTLTTISAYFDSEAEMATQKALSMIEPIMTIVLGCVIGFVVIAMYLPMFTMYNGM